MSFPSFSFPELSCQPANRWRGETLLLFLFQTQYVKEEKPEPNTRGDQMKGITKVVEEREKQSGGDFFLLPVRDFAFLLFSGAREDEPLPPPPPSY